MDEEKRYDVEAVKSRLQEYVENERDIDNQIERLEHLIARLEGLGAQVLTDMPKAPSAVNDRMAELIGQKEELEEEIRASVCEQSRERKRIEEILKHMKNPDERAVIQMKYLDRSSWIEVRDMMFGSKADFEGKEDTYLRRTHRIHGSALVNIARYIEENQNTAFSAVC